MGRTLVYGYNWKTGKYDIPLDYSDLTRKNNGNERNSNTVMDDTSVNGIPPTTPVNIYGDPVNHPSHYTSGKIEVIDFIEDQKLDFHLANAMKYICRAGKKNPQKTKEDLEKAIWYLNRYITHVLCE